MSRPSFEQTFLEMAVVLARRSTCSRLKVGCIITTADHSRVLALGFNGDAPGVDKPCVDQGPGLCCDPLHAEENAAIACTADHEVAKHVYVTHQPCLMCAKRLLRLGGVRLVLFEHPYRDERGVDLLRLAGVQVARRVERSVVREDG